MADSVSTSVCVYGRTLAQYEQIFDFQATDWQGDRILDCSGGPASFVSEANALGIAAIGVDPAYDPDPVAVRQRIEADIDTVVQLFPIISAQLGDAAPDPALVEGSARQAAAGFLADFEANRDRYIQAALPVLPFDDRQFDRVLCGNFLFIYASDDGFNYPFHYQSVLELYRVCDREVRISPTRGSGGGSHAYVEQLLSDLAAAGIPAELKAVRDPVYGETQMLLLTRPAE